ncbi:DUF5131 family protein [Ferrovum myxofaciens]|uniref:Phage Gp37/Gp68 family protein n=1 Tax=Ferrovum myxofaciens TaxID=416213 RepID=A0A9E6MWL5_9PROT|nr:phage Gp37/Gp68 family protein [Ferrovum myxofaciens]QKE37317.1 MAG: phage Gp37/Gp68 family protein [Ferrovum myxofaciens]QWY74962.1 MAG: phage Gp37/Gp68 family protein [Ferrovum myxofaciens]QWY77710.1 MAG: phage Gp37/Gp68 family protein [Ferrovum myxofaciens]
MSKTKIPWTDETWNPVTGCSKVSHGCKHCYAERVWPRLAANIKTVYHGRAFTDVMCHPERLRQPLLWSKPRMIFVNSMSDLFHESVSDTFIDQVFAVMGNVFCSMDAPHVFQVLTKRPERMRHYLSSPETLQRVTIAMKEMGLDLMGENSPPQWPLPNVWLGISVEDQETAQARVPHLISTPAAVRFISAEPLIGPIDLTQVELLDGYERLGVELCEYAGIDWIIVGCESGPNARPMNLNWARDIVDQCRRSDYTKVKVFIKQIPSPAALNPGQSGTFNIRAETPIKELSAFPCDLQVREYPNNRKGW